MNQRPNILLIMSDEHDPAVTGCYGHPHIETPHLDRLASEGTTFDSAYTACPICVPARMSFMTGQYVHQIGTWDNGSPLAGTIPHNGQLPRKPRAMKTAACGRTHFIGPRTPARLWQTAHGRRRKMETLEYGCPLAHARQPARQQQPRHRMRSRRKLAKRLRQHSY